MCLCPLNTVRINLVTLALITSKFMTCFQLLCINISCCVFPLFNRCLFSHAWPVLKRFRMSRQRELFDFLLRYERGRKRQKKKKTDKLKSRIAFYEDVWIVRVVAFQAKFRLLDMATNRCELQPLSCEAIVVFLIAWSF